MMTSHCRMVDSCSSRICSPTEGCWFSSGSRPRGRDLPVLMYWQCKGLSQADYGWQDLTRNIGKLQNHSSTVFKNLLYFQVKTEKQIIKICFKQVTEQTWERPSALATHCCLWSQARLLFPSEKCLYF